MESRCFPCNEKRPKCLVGKKYEGQDVDGQQMVFLLLEGPRFYTRGLLVKHLNENRRWTG